MATWAARSVPLGVVRSAIGYGLTFSPASVEWSSWLESVLSLLLCHSSSLAASLIVGWPAPLVCLFVCLLPMRSSALNWNALASPMRERYDENRLLSLANLNYTLNRTLDGPFATLLTSRSRRKCESLSLLAAPKDCRQQNSHAKREDASSTEENNVARRFERRFL